MQVGDTIAGYDIVAKLKSGGMAALYLGKRHGAAGFAKHVAIKVVHEHLADDENFIRMFLDEARITARIEHPNVVHVHDLGEANGHYFLVMEYVPSVALTQLLRAVAKLQRRLSPEVATWIAMQIAAGLHAAHETTDDEGQLLGLVHRDVSPKNILLAYKGYVKVIDFGIAKAAGRATKTQGGLLKGTFRYMSPEQARGQELDARSDLYALGICLWEMLVLRRLFDANSDLALLDMVRDPKIVPPGQLVGGIPPALDRVLMKALAQNREDRQASCDEFRAELARAVPAALQVTPRQVAELIGATMASEAVADADASVASAIGKPVTVQVPQAVIEKLTRSPNEDAAMTAGAAALQAQPLVVTPTGSEQVPTSGVVVRDPPSTVTPTPSHGGAQPLEPVSTQDGSVPGFAPPDFATAPAETKRPALIAALVAIPVLVGVGVTVAMVARSSGGPVAEPLPPREMSPIAAPAVTDMATAPVGTTEPEQPVAAAEEPAAEEPVAEEPAAEEPAAREPAAREPAAREPARAPMNARHTRRSTRRVRPDTESEGRSTRMGRRRTTMTDDVLLVDDVW